MKPRMLQMVLLVPVLLVSVSCGMDDLSQQGLAINFSPRDLPAGTAYIRYYVLTVQSKAGGTIDCDNFFVDNPRESVGDYAADTVDFGTVAFSATEGGAVVIKNLPEGAYVFYVEALDDMRSTLTCGCGEGAIVNGGKTNIPVLLVDDCL